ncbi:MerC domain-containing protein [Flavobacterium circumlabens]|uniref:MerC domain-containing protein n=1 Tax=Flavobacterium circumlabens TaxID=2133765 RepID=A0A4Y7U9T3_9FLAO|nr:MerC family mercury resistance protein [Flavobacterium circumlabens]TCN55410.1 MerC mercury resistance protein [Flavobacterium circumlabens]TEB43170.1 MerC domain-containing protein [Flavobacterium circumlabens]
MKNPEINKKTTPYDILGISSATLCLIHCIVIPLLTIIPFGLTDNYIVDLFFACIGLIVVSKILMSEATNTVKIILTISIFIIFVSILLEIAFDIDFGLILFGGIGMIIGHIINFKSHKHS